MGAWSDNYGNSTHDMYIPEADNKSSETKQWSNLLPTALDPFIPFHHVGTNFVSFISIRWFDKNKSL